MHCLVKGGRALRYRCERLKSVATMAIISVALNGDIGNCHELGTDGDLCDTCDNHEDIIDASSDVLFSASSDASLDASYPCLSRCLALKFMHRCLS